MAASESGFTCWGIFGASKIAHDFTIALKTLPEKEHKIVAVAARSLERPSDFASINIENVRYVRITSRNSMIF